MKKKHKFPGGGDLLAGATGLLGSFALAALNTSLLSGLDAAYNNLYRYAHPNYVAGNYDALASLYLQSLLPHYYRGTDFYNPNMSERFGLMFGSGITGFLLGRAAGNSFGLGWPITRTTKPSTNTTTQPNTETTVPEVAEPTSTVALPLAAELTTQLVAQLAALLTVDLVQSLGYLTQSVLSSSTSPITSPTQPLINRKAVPRSSVPGWPNYNTPGLSILEAAVPSLKVPYKQFMQPKEFPKLVFPDYLPSTPAYNYNNIMQHKLAPLGTTWSWGRHNDHFGYPYNKFDLGGDITGMVTGLGNVITNALVNNSKTKQAQAYADSLNSNFAPATTFNINRFNNALTDTGLMLQDGMLLNRKSYGGPLGDWWNTFSNGLRVIDEGGTHEENPLEGVPLGMAPDGTPNLVEEGEVIYNNYVYSNRLKLSKDLAKELGLGSTTMTYADAAKKLAAESDERPNDPISKRGLEEHMATLQLLQEEAKALKEQLDLEMQMANLLLLLAMASQMPGAAGPEMPVEEAAPSEDQMLMEQLMGGGMRKNGGHLFAEGDLLLFKADKWLSKAELDKALETNPNLLYVFNNGQYALLGEDFDALNPYSNIQYNEGKKYWTIKAPKRKYLDDKIAELVRGIPVLGSFALALLTASRKPNYAHLDEAIRAAANLPGITPSLLPTDFGALPQYDIARQAQAVRGIYANALAQALNSGMSRAGALAALFNLLNSMQRALGDNYILGIQANAQSLKERQAALQAALSANSELNMKAQAIAAENARAYANAVAAQSAAKLNIDDVIYSNALNTLSNALTQAGLYGNDRIAKAERDWSIANGLLPGYSAYGGKLNYKTNRRRKK